MGHDYQFRVIIAGGGVAGLVLANALEQAGVDFLLLERHDEVSPQIGQSIAAHPNGSRILDQLGLLDEWKKRSQACVWWFERDKDGNVLFKTDGVRLGCAARTGYDLQFGERSQYLNIFYANIKDKRKILVKKNITSVEPLSNGVRVRCEDGSSYQGDILAGADGVRSKVRDEMWRLAASKVPELVEHDKNALFAEYRALFGISKTPPGLPSGDCDFGFDTDRSTLVFGGSGNKSYIFIFEKMDKIYRGKKIPRFNKDDAIRFVDKHSNFKIRPNLTVGDFWDRIENYSLVPLEEGVFELWTWGRIACVGDSAHKMTPNIAAGGNAAIESAAALANAIKWMVDNSRGKPPSTNLVEKALQKYQKEREARVGRMVQSAGEVTRMQAGKSLYFKFAAKVARLYPGDFIADYLSGYFSGAVMLSYLPPPKASVQGHQPFNPTQGWSKDESKTKRALIALPLLVVAYLAMVTSGVKNMRLMLTTNIENELMSSNTGYSFFQASFYNGHRFDNISLPIYSFFTPAVYGIDPACRCQSFAFYANYGVVVTIWAFESLRRANVLTLAKLPGLFTLVGQLCGTGVTAPVYYFLHYVSAPVETLKASDMRLGRMNYAIVLLPSMILTYYIPAFAMFLWPNFPGRIWYSFVWQMFPILIYFSLNLLAFFVPDTTDSDRFESPTRDLPVIRYTIRVSVAISSLVWGLTYIPALFQGCLFDMFVPAGLVNHAGDICTFSRDYFKLDAIYLFGSTFLWLGYLFWDLKCAGMLTDSWFHLLLPTLCSFLFMGPGATTGLAWLWRENILASKRHQAAVIENTHSAPQQS